MRVKDDVLEVLDRATIVDENLYLPERLERKLYTRVKKAIEACGGQWDRRLQKHVFGGDPSALIETVIRTGEVRTSAEEGWFPTPPALAKKLVMAADIKPGMQVLEPSAGEGALVDAVAQNVWATLITVVESSMQRGLACQARLDKWRAAGNFIQSLNLCTDFMVLSLAHDRRYHRVVMNPPFAKSADARHVLAAYNLLLPGGRLVAIMGAGALFRDTQPYRDVRALVRSSGGITSLPPDSFKSSGTNVSTVMVTLNKPAAQ